MQRDQIVAEIEAIKRTLAGIGKIAELGDNVVEALLAPMTALTERVSKLEEVFAALETPGELVAGELVEDPRLAEIERKVDDLVAHFSQLMEVTGPDDPVRTFVLPKQGDDNGTQG